MILVYGSDESFVGDVIDHLRHVGHDVRGLSAEAHLFSEVVAHRANTVIGLGAQAPNHDDHQQLVDALIAASNAPTSPRVVLVTPGPLEGPHLRSLKRSGASYVVVSSPGERGLTAIPGSKARTVWLSRRLLEPEHAVVTKPALLCTIATAVSEEMGTGASLTPRSVSWFDALQAAGIRVIPVPNWLARFAYRCGAAALFLENGLACIRVGRDETLWHPVHHLLRGHEEGRAAAL